MRVTTASEGGTQGYLVGYGSKAYRNYVLFALTLIYKQLGVAQVADARREAKAQHVH